MLQYVCLCTNTVRKCECYSTYVYVLIQFVGICTNTVRTYVLRLYISSSNYDTRLVRTSLSELSQKLARNSSLCSVQFSSSHSRNCVVLPGEGRGREVEGRGGEGNGQEGRGEEGRGGEKKGREERGREKRGGEGEDGKEGQGKGLLSNSLQ